MAYKTKVLAVVVACIVCSSAYAQVGGGTELPSDAKAAQANGGAAPKMAKKPMKAHHSKMKKSKGKMPGHKTF